MTPTQRRPIERDSISVSLVEAALKCAEARVRITLTDAHAPKSMFAYATGFIVVYGLLCWLLGRRICAAPNRWTATNTG